jgi:hypothetical protein
MKKRVYSRLIHKGFLPTVILVHTICKGGLNFINRLAWVLKSFILVPLEKLHKILKTD